MLGSVLSLSTSVPELAPSGGKSTGTSRGPVWDLRAPGPPSPSNSLLQYQHARSQSPEQLKNSASPNMSLIPRSLEQEFFSPFFSFPTTTLGLVGPSTSGWDLGTTQRNMPVDVVEVRLTCALNMSALRGCWYCKEGGAGVPFCEVSRPCPADARLAPPAWRARRAEGEGV